MIIFAISLSENAFRLAVSLEFDEVVTWTGFISQSTILFQRNQTDSTKHYDFNRRIQEKGETVNSFAVVLREFSYRFGFIGMNTFIY